MKVLLTLTFTVIFHASCLSQNCKRPPAFISEWGFAAGRSALSSQQIRSKGVVLIEYIDPRQPIRGLSQSMTHPSWQVAGHVSSITLDHQGNAFVVPSPKVNTLDNPSSDQNTLYRIDASTGVMRPFKKLLMDEPPHMGNPFGLLGCTLDCDGPGLWLSTVAGSTRSEEKGKVWYISLPNGEATPIMSSMDIFGLAIIKSDQDKFLVYGAIRDQKIWFQKLGENNTLQGKPRALISLNGIGPRGDDIARKIVVQGNNELWVYGIPFYYNLTAPVVRQETIYKYQLQNGRWQLIAMEG